MGNPYGNIADVSGMFGAPETTKPPEGAGYASPGGKAVIGFDQFLKGIRAGHAQLQMQKYGQAENQLRVAKEQYEAISRRYEDAMKDPTVDAQTRKTLAEAQQNTLKQYNEASDELLNFFSEKSTGKGSRNQPGQQGGKQAKQSMGEKIGSFLKHFIGGQQPKTQTLPGVTTTFPASSHRQAVEQVEQV